VPFSGASWGAVLSNTDAAAACSRKRVNPDGTVDDVTDEHGDSDGTGPSKSEDDDLAISLAALARAEQLATSLQSALTSRAVIDQAIGILMSRTGVTADEADDQLRVLSQHEHTTMVAIAQNVVSQAVRLARARHQDEN
jgi:hypothetical protein